MQITFAKAAWEVFEWPVQRFLDRILSEGYNAAEVYLHGRSETPEEIGGRMAGANVMLIAQIGTTGATPEEHVRSLQTRYEHALGAQPRFVNCHTGKDFYSLGDNLRIFERAEQLVAKHGVPIRHESHRGRAMFSLPVTVQILRAMPTLQMTADVSHWMCVHESDLGDQEEALNEAIQRVDHIHGRVGFQEGPQVSDPRNPAHAKALARSVELWTRILQAAKSRGQSEFTITPEFGPVPYMPYNGPLEEPVADAWEVNRWMRDYLRENLRI